jgi:hypothetical protein
MNNFVKRTFLIIIINHLFKYFSNHKIYYKLLFINIIIKNINNIIKNKFNYLILIKYNIYN